MVEDSVDVLKCLSRRGCRGEIFFQVRHVGGPVPPKTDEASVRAVLINPGRGM
jgi:hypothetical protein